MDDGNAIVNFFISWKVAVIILLYTFVMWSWLPLIIYVIFVLMLLGSCLILKLKENISGKIRVRKRFTSVPTIYKSVASPKLDDDKEEIDWSGFDVNNYPRVNYRKVFYMHIREENRSRFEYLYSYPRGDIYLICVIAGMILLAYAEWKSGQYSFMRGCGLTALLLIIGYMCIPFKGKKYYLEDCKYEYLYDIQHGEK